MTVPSFWGLRAGKRDAGFDQCMTFLPSTPAGIAHPGVPATELLLRVRSSFREALSSARSCTASEPTPQQVRWLLASGRVLA
jgi:hypothetical protein